MSYLKSKQTLLIHCIYERPKINQMLRRTMKSLNAAQVSIELIICNCAIINRLITTWTGLPL